MLLVPEKMTAGIGQEPNLEKQIRKQMGCMAGFLQIFDRHQILTGKRLCSPNGLVSSPLNDSSREPQENVGSPAMSTEMEKSPQVRSMLSPDPNNKSELRTAAPEPATPSQSEAKASLPLSVFDFKEGTRSSWKFSKEAPRLSLDSRAVVDAKGSLKPREIRTNASILSANGSETVNDDGDKQRRSPSVIARLMGLEPMLESEPEPAKKVELRRSASESRVSRDLFQNRVIDGVNLQLKQNQPTNLHSNVMAEDRAKHDRTINNKSFDPKEYNARTARAEPAKSPHRGIGQRKCFYDSADFFPEPKQTVSLYEIEKRLKQRGIDEPSKDLETLRYILEALQLKGLLHSNKHSSPANSRTFVYEPTYPQEESPIVLMKPARRLSTDYAESYRSEPGGRRNPNFRDDFVSASQRRGRLEIEPNVRNQTRGRGSVSPVRSEISGKSPNRRRPLSVESGRANDSTEQRRVSPIQSPRFAPRRNGSDPATNRSPRIKNPTAEIKRKVEKVLVPAEDESSSVSGSSLISTNSQIDTERWRGEECRGGRNLLERCDKLLQSIAEMTTNELQPSPVSVLDSSFCKEESSPSPVMKRSIDFKELPFEWEDEVWSPPAISSVESKSDDCDFFYISDILRAANYLSDDSQLFLFLEKQQYLKGQDTSNGSMLQRKLIFDNITEILTRKRRLPPWKVVSASGQTSLQQVWSEFQKIKVRDDSEDVVQVICGVLKKDLAGDAINGWGDCPVEMSEAVLDIERLIFKDLIGEAIRDLAALSRKCSNRAQLVSRRKLVF